MDTSRSSIPGLVANNGLKILRFNDDAIQAQLEAAEKKMAPGTAYFETVVAVPTNGEGVEFRIAVGAKAKVGDHLVLTAQGIYEHSPSQDTYAGKITANF